MRPFAIAMIMLPLLLCAATSPAAEQDGRSESRGGFNYQIPLSPRWRLGFSPFAGYGRLHFSDAEALPGDDRRTQMDYGVRIGSYWKLTDNLQIGLEIPYQAGRLQPIGAGADGTGRPMVTNEPRLDAALSIALRF